MTVTIRALVESDHPNLRTATLSNMNWSGTERFSYKDIDLSAELCHYFDFKPARGDFGFVAEQDGMTVGVIWLLFLDEKDPGFGFVAQGVPELSINVFSGYHAQGIGKTLMRTAMVEATIRKIECVSLSVEEGNPALKLYLDLGFSEAEHAAPGTYVLEALARR